MTTRITQAIRREKRENFGYPHPRKLIRENPDWALNREIYIPRKIPGIRYVHSNKLVLKLDTIQFGQ